MIGSRLGKFEILAKLGEGGMGEVFLAMDSQLGRRVALKLIRAERSGSEQLLARLRREARALASLQHPNVAMLFGFEGGDATPYLIMELVEGSDLRQRIDAGPIPPSEARELARQIAEGLAAAHARGIVHRDLKPSNVRVTADGTVKILDFGLAKQLVGSDDAMDTQELTKSDALLGTPAYMAPERLRGDAGDARGDLFAFGLVLHEMLCGRHPFARANTADTIAALIAEEAPSLADEFGGLGAVVDRCLRKHPRDRFASAAELVAALAVEDESDAGSIASIAVLPFANDGDDVDVDYLIDGICDSLIDNLSQLPHLKVMARSTVFRCRQLFDRPDEIARELRVRAVLTGELKVHRDDLTLRAELVDGRDGQRLWGGRFRRPVRAVLEIESEICREITDRLSQRLTEEQRTRIANRHARDPHAHEAYLQGRFFWNRWKTADAMHTAIRYFEEALRIDPLYALAHGGLADCYNILGNIKALPPEEAFPRAKDEVRKGLAMDDTLGELHTSLGFIHRNWDWDWPAAERELAKAIELNPNYSTGHRFYGFLLSGLGRHDQAIGCLLRALELDPLSPVLHTSVGDVYFYARRFDEAMDYYRRAIAMDDACIPGHSDLARVLEQLGRYDEAIREYRRAQSLASGELAEPSSGLAHVYARMGRREEALAIVDALHERARTRYQSPYGFASIYACLGEIEMALDWLEKALAARDQTLTLIGVHPRLDALRAEPRFQAVLERMDLR